MTDPNRQPAEPADFDDNPDRGAGVNRPDQGGTTQPGQTPAPPATGGEGAEGAGGPDGFGTGT